MPKFTVEFQVYCAKCGNGLCRNTTTDVRNGEMWAAVDPCEKCLEAARENGYSDGYDAAERESGE